jgi:phenylpyruvate tautomerase PptA (4-oxalocrotonate tautomerase family)
LDEAQKHDLCEEIGKLMPLIPGKTRENTMMNIMDGCYMEKVDASEPSLNLEVRVLGAVPEANKRDYVEKICALFEKKPGISPGRVTINFVEFDCWGTDGKLLKAGA